MNLFDVFRYSVFATFGIGIGFMFITNILAYQVLRPPQTMGRSSRRVGFLWWHVTAISLSFACIGIVAIEFVASKLGDPASWRSLLVLTGTTLFMVAQIIIFRIERQRLVTKQAGEVVKHYDR